MLLKGKEMMVQRESAEVGGNERGHEQQCKNQIVNVAATRGREEEVT